MTPEESNVVQLNKELIFDPNARFWRGTSVLRDTPWDYIRYMAQASMTARGFADWLKRDDVIERSKRLP